MPIIEQSHKTIAAPTYQDGRPITVINDFTELQGPTHGTVTLPVTLDWGPRPTYDLDEPIRLRNLYRTVLREAMDDDDLRQWLDSTILKQIWHEIMLPTAVRNAWEQRHPELTE